MTTGPATIRALCVAALAACMATAAWAQPQRVPGSRVRLTPPAGFAPATHFAGFQDDTGTTIAITELPGAPLGEITQGMTREGLAGQRMALRDSASVRVSGTDGLWLHVVQDTGGALFHKQILVAADERSVFMAVATFRGEPTVPEAKRLWASLMTLAWADEAPSDVFEGLPFRVDVPAVLRRQQRVGGALLLSELDDETPNAPEEAFAVVAVESGAIAPTDAERRATERARRTATLSAFSKVTFRPTVIGGRTAYEVTGSAVHEASGTPVWLYQMIVPMTLGYYILQGVVGADREAEFTDVFRSLAGSFRDVASSETVEE